MSNSIPKYFLLTFFLPLFLNASEFSVMALNVDNLFDTIDDPGKDDKAYLPIEAKQSEGHKKSCMKIKVKSWKNECLYLDWDEDTKNSKLINLVASIVSYDKSGPDILAMQEVENINILNQLYKLLEPYGYSDIELIEGNDYRGIDTALISKFNIIEAKLHYITFNGEFENKDTRPILDATLDVYNKKIKFYNVHFPSGFHDVSMRIDSLNVLKTLLDEHSYPAVALGDFNVNTQEDTKLGIYMSQESNWSVAHLNGCKKCKGSYYYNYGKRWEFLDSIFLSKERGLSYVTNSIDVHATTENSYSDTGKPMDFNPNTKNGVSDHLPMVARIKIN
tara:strand:+ start:1027 stop:2028 length:1002 start_codon:yes stop_codon:yes gene_type:complete